MKKVLKFLSGDFWFVWVPISVGIIATLFSKEEHIFLGASVLTLIVLLVIFFVTSFVKKIIAKYEYERDLNLALEEGEE